MLPIAQTNRWPTDWYDANNQLVCPADGCHRVFPEDQFQTMKAHWNNIKATKPQLPGHDDHAVLLAMSQQTKCVHFDDRGRPCNFDPQGNLQTLLNHEQCEHGRLEMSTMGKYLALVRKGRLAFPEKEDEVYAFARLVANIVTRPQLRDPMFKFHLPETPLDRINEKKTDWVVTILQSHNKSDGRRPCEVFPAEDFRVRMTPPLFDDTDWPQAWRNLRSMYEEGTI